MYFRFVFGFIFRFPTASSNEEQQFEKHISEAQGKEGTEEESAKKIASNPSSRQPIVEEDDKNSEQQQEQYDDQILSADDKPPHYVKFGKSIQFFHGCCPSIGRLLLPDGWWIKHRCYNRRYASLYNSFQPRPTAWAPLVNRLFLFSVAVASSLGGCFIPVTYVGTVALLIGLVFLIARPCRRPFDNVLLALQLILGSTLAFARSTDADLSVKLFYAVIGVTFLYSIHIILLEIAEMVSMRTLEETSSSTEKDVQHELTVLPVDSASV